MKEGLKTTFPQFALKGAIYNYVGTFFSSLLSLLILVLLVRHLSVQDFGLYSLVVTTLIFFALALSWGMPYVVTRFVSEYVEKQEWGRSRWLLKRCYAILFLSFVLLIPVIHPLSRILAQWVRNDELMRFVPFLLIFCFLRVSILLVENTLNAFLLRKYVVTGTVTALTLKLLLFAWLLSRSAALEKLFTAWIVTETLLLVVYLVRVLPLLFGKRETKGEEAKGGKGEIFRFGAALHIDNFLHFLLDTRVDLYMVSHFLSATATGWYAFAAQLANALVTFSPALVLKSVITPLFLRQYAKTKDLDEQKFLYRINCKIQAFILFPFIMISAVLMPAVIKRFFKADYLAALPAFWTLAFFGLIKAVAAPLATFIWTLKKPIIIVKGSLPAVTFWLISAWFLTKKWGMIGTAIASGVSPVLAFFLHYMMTKQIVSLETPWLSLVQIALHASLAGGVVFLLSGTATSLTMIVALAFLGGAVFLCLSYFRKVFDAEERKLLQRAFPVNPGVF